MLPPENPYFNLLRRIEASYVNKGLRVDTMPKVSAQQVLLQLDRIESIVELIEWNQVPCLIWFGRFLFCPVCWPTRKLAVTGASPSHQCAFSSLPVPSFIIAFYLAAAATIDECYLPRSRLLRCS